MSYNDWAKGVVVERKGEDLPKLGPLPRFDEFSVANISKVVLKLQKSALLDAEAAKNIMEYAGHIFTQPSYGDSRPPLQQFADLLLEYACPDPFARAIAMIDKVKGKPLKERSLEGIQAWEDALDAAYEYDDDWAFFREGKMQPDEIKRNDWTDYENALIAIDELRK